MSYIFVGNLLTYQFFFIKQIYTAIEKKINRLKFWRKKNQILEKKLLKLPKKIVKSTKSCCQLIFLCDDISMYKMSCVLWRKGFLWIKIADQQRKVVFSSESSNQGVSNTFLQMTGPHPYITCLLSTYEPFFFFLLQELGIKDEFHQSALLVCFDELCGRDSDEVSSSLKI